MCVHMCVCQQCRIAAWCDAVVSSLWEAAFSVAYKGVYGQAPLL